MWKDEACVSAPRECQARRLWSAVAPVVGWVRWKSNIRKSEESR